MQVTSGTGKIRGGGHGSIIGRDTFQRPREQAVTMLSKVIGIYLGKS